jgi:2-iminobutanoate/2-iminopropanoate deaminase
VSTTQAVDRPTHTEKATQDESDDQLMDCGMTLPPPSRSPFVYASSLAIDVATMTLVPEADTIEHEVGVVVGRIASQLEKAGLGLADVVKTTCYLRDEQYLDEFRAAYREAFGPGPYPASHTVILGLAGNCRVQIETVAVKSGLA